jgi:hypothetical protein
LAVGYRTAAGDPVLGVALADHRCHARSWNLSHLDLNVEGKSMRNLAIAALLLLGLGACTTTLSDQDRAMITAASQNAEQAKQQAAQALAAAQAAQADARAANEKADRMFQRSLRK